MRRTTVGIETVVLLKAIIILLRFIAERKQGAYFWFSASACSQGGISDKGTISFPVSFEKRALSAMWMNQYINGSWLAGTYFCVSDLTKTELKRVSAMKAYWVVCGS